MIIVRMKGGLGNQLFQYAYGLKLAKKYNHKIVLDISDYRGKKERDFQLHALGIEGHVLIKSKIIRLLFTLIYKIGLTRFIPVDYILENGLEFNFTFKNKLLNYLDGYFQSREYFHEIENDLKKIICNKIFLNVNKKNIDHNKVAIHIRRGDYLSNKIYHNLDKLYYYNAIEFIKKNIKSPQFYVFSDDNSYARDIFVDRYIDFKYSNSKCTIEDFSGIASCNHFILANSTFSWWASLVGQSSDSILIAPEKWYEYISVNRKMLFRKEWVTL